MEFRTLKASEIQVRPTDTKTKGRATLLLYQDARVGMDILDDTVGTMNWSKEYYEVAGNVYCKVGIRNPETGEWTYKADCGTESNVDAEKGQASDAFKRAVVNWGIGRELYNTPRIKIDCPENYYYNDRMTMTFSVKTIEFENKECKKLVIVDKFGKEVYNYGGSRKEVSESKSNCDILKEFCGEKKREEGIDKDELLRFWNYYCPKMDGWDNTVQPDKLWKRWLETKRSSN